MPGRPRTVHVFALHPTRVRISVSMTRLGKKSAQCLMRIKGYGVAQASCRCGNRREFSFQFASTKMCCRFEVEGRGAHGGCLRLRATHVDERSSAETSSSVKPVVVLKFVDLDALSIGNGRRRGHGHGCRRSVEVKPTARQGQRLPEEKKRGMK